MFRIFKAYPWGTMGRLFVPEINRNLLHNLINAQFVGCGDSTHRCRVSGTKSLKRLVLPTARRDSPRGCPLSAQPIQGYRNCNLLIISFCLRVAPQLSDIHFPRFGISFLSEKRNACKERADSGFHPETPATPRRSTQLATLSQQLGTFARKRAGA